MLLHDDQLELMRRLRNAEDTGRLTYGIVVTVSPTLTVTVGSSTTAVPAARLLGYAPRVGDFVAVIERPGDRLVLGVPTTEIGATPGNLAISTPFDVTTSGTTLLDTPNLAATVGSNRRIRVTVALAAGWFGSVSGDNFDLAIRVDGVAIDSTFKVTSLSSGGYLPPGAIVAQTTALAAGSHQFDATAQRTSGTGTLTLRGRIIVDDAGPA